MSGNEGVVKLLLVGEGSADIPLDRCRNHIFQALEQPKILMSLKSCEIDRELTDCIGSVVSQRHGRPNEAGT